MLGCAQSTKDKKTYVCCNYSPHGNIMTRFEANVPRLVSKDQGKANEDESVEDLVKKMLQESRRLKKEGQKLLEKSRLLKEESQRLATLAETK